MKVFGGALSRQQESDQSYLGDDHAPYLSLRLVGGLGAGSSKDEIGARRPRRLRVCFKVFDRLSMNACRLTELVCPRWIKKDWEADHEAFAFCVPYARNCTCIRQ